MVESPLWSHQVFAVEKARNLENMALLLDPGCGKTRTAITILREKYNTNRRILRTLILGPTAVIQNWKSEIKKFSKIPDSIVFPLTESLVKRADIYNKTPHGSIYISNHEAMAFASFTESVLNNPPEVLIVDESHFYKDISSKRTKSLIKLTHIMQKLPVKHRYILTGTPVLRNLDDLFSQFLILDAGATFGTNFYKFRAEFFEDKNRHIPRQRYFPNWQIKNGSIDKIKHKIAAVSVEAKKEMCLDLPDFVRQEYEVELSKEQRKAYEEMRLDFITFLSSGVATAQLALTKMLRLQQIVSGFINKEDGEPHVFSDNPRLSALSDLLESITPTQKTIVWSVFKNDYAQLEKVCKKLKLEYRMIVGDTEDKQKSVDDFNNNENVRVMIASQAAGGTGINLTAASCAIYYSRSYSLGHDIQSEARNYRGGSEIHKKITRIDLVARNTVDQLVLSALREKKNLADSVLELKDLI